VKIERSGIFSNYGPTNQELERAFVERLFGGVGHCVTTCNATVGLILAIRQAVDFHFGRGAAAGRGKKYALMPAFTFAATAQAAIWNNLVPLLCDVDPDTWLPSLRSQTELLERFAGEVAVVVPYATFGNNLDLRGYAVLSSRYDVPVVVDAAASLGSIDGDGRQFGTGCASPVVYSMHVTKTFSSGEAGLVYCENHETIRTLRCMANFGFEQPRSATMPGLNGKLSEIGALLCREKLNDIGEVVERRQILADAYRRELPGFLFQMMNGPRHAYQFMPALLPDEDPRGTEEITAQLATFGVSARSYFSPHLAEQTFFRENSVFFNLPVTDAIAARIISLPLYDDMTVSDVAAICERLRAVLSHNRLSLRLRPQH
jgi:dTDP-4-amino-4,6-dideoxygalactose transaminase